MSQRENHEARTDLYEKAKPLSKGQQELGDLLNENYRLQEFNSYGRSTDAPGKERDLSAPRWYETHPAGPEDARSNDFHRNLVAMGGDIGSHRPGELTKLALEMNRDPNHPFHEGLPQGIVGRANTLHKMYKNFVAHSGAKL
jgi:hypothetical protein